MGLELRHVVDGIAQSALEELDRTGAPAAGELRQRLRKVLEDQAMVAARAMSGQDVSVAQAAVKARLDALGVAGLLLSVGQVQRAVQGAILTALRLAFTALL
jgi:hypothetical protein